jgi:hypothetical protein
MHPPLAYPVFDNVDRAKALAKASKTTLPFFRHGFDPLRKPDSLRSEDEVFIGIETITKGNVSDF